MTNFLKRSFSSSSHYYSKLLTPKSLERTRTKLVPEMELRLLTSSHKLWHEPLNNNFEDSISNENTTTTIIEPFWSIFWPGGQVLSRYILDSKCVENQKILDLGCGCGAQGIKLHNQT